LYEQTQSFRIYEHNVIPGLFQTADYAAAMLSFWVDFLGTSNDIGAAVAARMERQRVIYERDKQFTVVLEEQALRTWFGDAGTQAGQLDRLLAIMSLPTVTLGVIPMMTERTAVGSAGFWIFDDSLVALETPTATIEVTRPQEITLYAHSRALTVTRMEQATTIRRARMGQPEGRAGWQNQSGPDSVRYCPRRVQVWRIPGLVRRQRNALGQRDARAGRYARHAESDAEGGTGGRGLVLPARRLPRPRYHPRQPARQRK
jgi:hypothetical protein